MHKIVIIGGGLSGMLLTIHLLKYHYSPSLNITLIEKKQPGMLGLAYSTDNICHLLNAPASKMSAFADNSFHFTDWLTNNGYAYHGKSFVPRAIYKKYIYSVLETALEKRDHKNRVTFLHDHVTDINTQERFLLLDSGMAVAFDSVVLALGNYDATTLNLGNNEYLRHPAYFSSAWNQLLMKDTGMMGKLLILGSGLTMVDTVLSLHQRNYTGQIISLSNHGLTPVPHTENTAYSISDLQPQNIHHALDAFRIVRKHIKDADSWQSVIDAIRPFTQTIWLQLPVEEKRKFMEHLRHLWGVTRHRVPPECWKVLQQKELSVVAGKVRAIKVNVNNTFDVLYRERHCRYNSTMTVDAIVNCLGPESNYEKLNDPLVKSLLRKGLIRTDALKLGIDCTKEGIVIDQAGNPSTYMYTIGPPAKGVLWEITSVPEIRTAAMHLAKLVADKQNAIKQYCI